MVVHIPKSLAVLGISPITMGCRAVNPFLCDTRFPGQVLHLLSSTSWFSVAWWGNLRLLKGNIPVWQGRVSFDGASLRTAVIYGVWHSHDYIHTHACISSPVFPAPLSHNFGSGNIILVSGKSSSLWDC